MLYFLHPNVDDRVYFNPYSALDWVTTSIPGLTMLLAAKFAFDQPQSIAWKLLLVPFGTVATYRMITTYDFSAGVPEYKAINYILACVGCAMVLKLFEVAALTARPVYAPVRQTRQLQKGGHDRRAGSQQLSQATLGDLVHYLFDPRGISYDFGAGTFQAPETRNIDNRTTFLLFTFLRCLLFFTLCDLTLMVFQSIPGMTATPEGGSLYNPEFSSPLRFLTSTTLVLCTGCATYFGLSVFHYTTTLISVGLFRQDPAEHPFLFWYPYMATLVRELWGKRWHSLFRPTFMVLGWKPGYDLLGEVGGLMSVFIISGLVHDIGLWGFGKGTDPWHMVGFFWLQSVGIILEGFWRRITGRKVQGGWGRVWTWIWLICTSHIAVEAWLLKGIGGAVNLVPDEFRPVWQLKNSLISYTHQ
ncbi:hypothetical protein FRB95_013476 [Tulasnella sp. JGI-2019a]|nr:hypothetical protein FRB95_013476 [Tulasnella sp. JGI-2019a]